MAAIEAAAGSEEGQTNAQTKVFMPHDSIVWYPATVTNVKDDVSATGHTAQHNGHPPLRRERIVPLIERFKTTATATATAVVVAAGHVPS